MRDYARPAHTGLILLLAACGLSMPPYQLGNQVEYPRHTRVAADIQGLTMQLKLYYSMNDFFPTTAQGLEALVEQPMSSPVPHRWFQTFDHIPKDPWQNDYVYRCPGLKDPNGYDLFSAGPDRRPDTADDDWGM